MSGVTILCFHNMYKPDLSIMEDSVVFFLCFFDKATKFVGYVGLPSKVVYLMTFFIFAI